jgi:cell division protein FtsI (penicillin-binding protein 3)
MRPADAIIYRAPVGWRWVVELIWRLEHAFERAKATGKAENDSQIRIFFILAVFAAGFLTLAAGAAKTSLFPDVRHRAGYAGAAQGARADLVDREGRLIATDLTFYGLYVNSNEIWDPEETRVRLHAALPRLAVARLDRALRSDRREYLLGGLTPQERARINDMGLPGVTFEAEEKRVYPAGATGAHLIGFSDRGGVGLSGVERGFDEAIRNQAQTGQPFALSLDLRVQAALEDELQQAVQRFQAVGGVGIVTDVHTGEVIGLASAPDFDPNNVGAATPQQMKNQAAASVFEPGSVWKVFTLAAGLDSGVAQMNSTYAVDSLRIGDRVINDFHAVGGVMTLPEIFIHSSNIGTAKLALQSGPSVMTRYWKKFGLFDPAPIELAESTRPIVPKKWPDTTLASASFGQSISVTPLQVAAAMGSVLNGGTYVPLTLKRLGPEERPHGQRVISEDTSRKMLDLMRLNVTSKEGSGGKADAPGLSVGGKTGSAQKVIGGRYAKDTVVASFAAVFPTDGPIDAKRYFVLILLDEPKGMPETYGFRTAGWNASPTAGKVIDRIAPFLGVRRAYVAPDLSFAAATAAKPVPQEAISGDER